MNSQAQQPALRCAWADAPADQITRAQIEALRTQRLAEGVKDVTAGRSVLAVQIVWKWAQAQGLLPEGLKCPCKGVPIGKSAILIETYPDEQRAWIFAAAKAARNPMLYPFLVCAMNSAMRKGELFGLCWPRVVLRGGSPRFLIDASYGHAPKSGKSRTVPIVSPLVCEVLTAWRTLCPETEAGLVFPIQGRHGCRGRSPQFHKLGFRTEDGGGEGCLPICGLRPPPLCGLRPPPPVWTPSPSPIFRLRSDRRRPPGWREPHRLW